MNPFPHSSIKTPFLIPLLPIISLLIAGCATKHPYYHPDYHASNNRKVSLHKDSIDFEIFVLGDMGLESNIVNTSDIISMIKSELKADNSRQAVVFLGNSIAPNGLPEEENPAYQKTATSLKHCVGELSQKTDHLYFIPGNNEWSNGNKYTVDALQATEDFIEAFAKKEVFFPKNGCGEPVEIPLTNNLLLVLIDSQWLIQGDHNDERTRSSCEIDDNLDFITYMKDIISSNKQKNILLAAHHPIRTNGITGGNFPLINHLFPLPVLGSLITGARKIAGNNQRFGHPDYESYRAAMNTILENCEGCILLSSHENNMQYFHKKNKHYVITGSAKKVSYARKGEGASFAYMKQGFAKITHTKNLKLWLEFYTADPQNPNQATPVFQTLLYQKVPPDFKDTTIFKVPESIPQTVITNASDIFETNFPLLNGHLYRKAWKQEVEFPVLLLHEVEGGLKPIKQGGGFQTKSLRLQNEKGQQWVLRSIFKDVEKVVPPALRNTFVQKIIQDGVAASHPYAAFVVPTLAEAAGIYHTNPKAVYLPAQTTLGEYHSDFSETLYLFEERAGGNTSHFEDFGNPEKTISTPSLLAKLSKNHKHMVDQKAVLRARLFDLLIGDWDRHDDQWRWAAFEKDKKTIYLPIPRDRDQVFFKANGILPYIATRPYFAPQLRSFKHKIHNLRGLIFNARYFDRSFLHALSRQDFIETAQYLQNHITDQVIQRAFDTWPTQIFQHDGPEIIAKLKSRRKDLVKYAIEYHQYINQFVTLTGTRDKDIFIIHSLPGNKLSVRAYHEKEKEENLLYSNILDGNITRELRLFGLKDKDVFNLTGNHSSSIKIRVIGGRGMDVLDNQNPKLPPIVYDRPDGMKLKGHRVRKRLKDQRGINSYDRFDWKPDKNLFLPLLTFYTDEGVGISLNLFSTTYGFRSNPYQANHKATSAYFQKNKAILLNYEGDYPNALGKSWDLGVNFYYAGPLFMQYYYGLGNDYVDFETTFPLVENANTSSFHFVKGTKIDFYPRIKKRFGHNNVIILGPLFEFFNIKNSADEPRLYLLPESGINPVSLDKRYYTGIELAYNNTRLDHPAIPARGFVYDLKAIFKQNVKDNRFNHLTLSSKLITYIPFNQKKTVVLAMHLGGAYSRGVLEFFHYQYLSNASRLRGYKTNRFAGEGIAYHATDLRFIFFHSKGAFPIHAGCFAAFDYGKAWYNEGDSSSKWHYSMGGGIILQPLNMFGFKFGYYRGKEDAQLSMGGSLSF